MPNEIGGQHVPQLGEEDLKTHVSVEAILEVTEKIFYRLLSINKIDNNQ